jgi:hypothetical protein
LPEAVPARRTWQDHQPTVRAAERTTPGELMTFFNFPPPKESEEFERLVEQIAGPMLRSQIINLNGRRGQAQQGVDISVTTADREIGIQCKVTEKLKIDSVQAEVTKAISYTPKLDHFIVATTAPSDAGLQAEVRTLQAPFDVSLWSWDEINNQLNRQPGVALDYVQLVLIGSPQSSEKRHAEHLREAFDRPALLDGAHAERNFEAQLDALSDTSAFLRTGLLYTRNGVLVSGLPYRRYGTEHAEAAATILKRVQKLSTFTKASLHIFRDWQNPRHQQTLNEAEKLRIAVLDAANVLLQRCDVPPLPLTI